MSKTIEDKLNEGRQYRSFSLAEFEHRAEDDGKMIVRGYASTFNQPYRLFETPDYIVDEQVAASAFDNCDMSDVILQYNHEGRVFARGSNGTLKVEPDFFGLCVEAELSGTEIGRQLYEEIDGGYTTKMSFGFRVAKDERDVKEDYENGKTRVLRTITEISRLYDVSAVSLPANDATSISARSYGEGVVAELLEEVERRKEIERKREIIRRLLEE